MGAAGRWFITPHAVDRYRRRVRHARGYSYEEALAELVELSEKAHYVKELNDDCELWRGPRPHRLRFYVAPADGPVRLPQLMTVLAGYDAAAPREGC